MEKNTAIELTDKLLQSRGMKPVMMRNPQGEEETGKAHIYIDFRKSSLYVINLVDEESFVPLERQSRMVKDLFEQRNIFADHIFILHLIVTGESEDQNCNSWEDPDLESGIIEFYWLLDYIKEKMIYPKNQPNSFLNLDKELVAVLHSKEVSNYAMGNRYDKSYASYTAILIHLGIWIIQELLGGSRQLEILLQMGAMNVLLVLDGQWFRLVTAMFLHIGLSHLMMNVAGIYIFGTRMEKQISAVEWTVIYLLGGLFGNIVSFGYHLWMEEVYVISAGASGGVYALVGGLLAITYFTKRRAGELDAYAILIYFLIGIIVSAIDIQIDLAAHLGGFVAGFIMTWRLIQKRKQLI